MNIRVKYCGGCNPRYDRRAELDRLKTAFPEASFVEMGDDVGPFDHVIVLCGCTAMCAEHEHLHGEYGKTVTASAEDCEQLEGILRAIPT